MQCDDSAYTQCREGMHACVDQEGLHKQCANSTFWRHMPTPNRTLFSTLSALLLHTRIGMIGASVVHQAVSGINCDMQRLGLSGRVTPWGWATLYRDNGVCDGEQQARWKGRHVSSSCYREGLFHDFVRKQDVIVMGYRLEHNHGNASLIIDSLRRAQSVVRMHRRRLVYLSESHHTEAKRGREGQCACTAKNTRHDDDMRRIIGYARSAGISVIDFYGFTKQRSFPKLQDMCGRHTPRTVRGVRQIEQPTQRLCCDCMHFCANSSVWSDGIVAPLLRELASM